MVLPVAVLMPAAMAQTFYNVPALSFTMAVGGANPLPQVVAIASTTDAVCLQRHSLYLRPAAAGSRRARNWWRMLLRRRRPSLVSVNASTLSAGTYTGQIIFAEYFRSERQSITVPVTLTVVSPGTGTFFGDVAGQASFTMVTGGRASPAPKHSNPKRGEADPQLDRNYQHRGWRQLV